MSPLHHILIAWLIANLVETDVRTRRFALVAGAIPDIDGIPVLFSNDLFHTYHHTFAHTLVFGIVVSAFLCAFVKRKTLAFSLILSSFIAHVCMDVVGSWGVPIFAPFIPTAFSTSPILSTDLANGVVYPAIQIIAWSAAVAILLTRKRTPIEFFSKKWDYRITNFLMLPFTAKCHVCGRRAFFRCETCTRTACTAHVEKETKRIACIDCGI